LNFIEVDPELIVRMFTFKSIHCSDKF